MREGRKEVMGQENIVEPFGATSICGGGDRTMTMIYCVSEMVFYKELIQAFTVVANRLVEVTDKDNRVTLVA